MACFTVSHKKALHNYFIPCPYLRKTYGNFPKSTEISGNFQKLWKHFKLVSENLNGLKKVLENVWQSLEVFGKIRRRSKMVLKCTENLRKYSEVFGNSRKTSETAQKCFSDDFMFF